MHAMWHWHLGPNKNLGDFVVFPWNGLKGLAEYLPVSWIPLSRGHFHEPTTPPQVIVLELLALAFFGGAGN